MAQALFEHEIPALFSNYTKGLRINNFNVDWSNDLPLFFTNAIHCENFLDLEINGFKGKSAHPDLYPSISLKDGKEVSIKNCKADNGTIKFLKHVNIQDFRFFMGNDLSNAVQVMEPEKSDFSVIGNLYPK